MEMKWFGLMAPFKQTPSGSATVSLPDEKSFDQ